MQQSEANLPERAELAKQAIRDRRVLAAVYNGQRLELQPHQLFARHDALYLRAVNPAKSRRKDEAPTLGAFRMSGLSELTLTGSGFDPVPAFDRDLPRPEDRLLVEVARV